MALMIVGVLLLLDQTGVVRVAMRNVWPVFLVAFGGSMIWRALSERRVDSESR